MTCFLGRALPAVLWILLAQPIVAAADVIRVGPGESIAQGLEGAPPGSVVEVEPGVYHEALTVDTPGITLRGIVREGARPVLDGKGELGDGVIASGSPFSMSGFEIRHYVGNGVTTQGVDGVVLTDLVIDDTGLYGVYPVQSRNIEVTHTTVTGIRDAGIYVGESNRALVAYNEVHRNVAGIEIENTNDAVVRDNLVYDNTAGIAVFVLPNKVQKEGARTHVLRNWVLRNNRANFGDPEAIIGQLPHGVGIFVMGADDTLIEDNWVKHNVSAGLAVLRLAKENADKDPELEPNADRTRLGFNQLVANGLSPHPEIAAGYGRGADVMWDGTGTGNCADLPDAVTRGGTPLARCAAQAARPPSPLLPPGQPGPSATLPRSQDFDGPVVRIRGMRFEPHEIEIGAGQTVTWINEDAVTHTVTSGKGTRPTSAPLASPFLPRGGVYQFTFERSGDYEYLCLPHLDQAPMRGARVRVADADS
ncbi:MAG: parallel beta-helix domain-containing protein [Myxococcota bacterium]|nr:parallel beta-helix domain-containing protein [Myxococcota bacterium]